jgi:hypothetical protein
MSATRQLSFLPLIAAQAKPVAAKGMIPRFLVHSYMYYILNRSVISDAEYDALCADILEAWDGIEHMHKHLVDPEALKAGTGFYLKRSDYPLVVRSVAHSLLGGRMNP